MANSDYKKYTRPTPFAPLAEIVEPLDYLDRELVLGRSTFPRIDSLRIGMAALCDDEFMAITAIAPGRVAVKRGVADTVPARHDALSLVWFIENDVTGTDRKEYSAGETSSVKYSPITMGGGSLDIGDTGEVDAVQFNWRMYRPYPPGALRVRGARWFEAAQIISADDPKMTLTWAHRDRTLQADQLNDHDDPNIGPEPGTTYTVRIYDKEKVLRRTEVGIMADTRDMYGALIDPSWTYTWPQAVSDLDVVALEKAVLTEGYMTIFSTRDGFDSWQGYEIPFSVNSQGFFMKVAQAAQLAAQSDDIAASGGPYPPNEGMYAANVGQIVAQPLSDSENNANGPTSGMYVASLHEGVGQQTSFYTNLNRNMFEAPYAHLLKRQDSASATKLVTVTARPSDRLTDTHEIWTRYDYPLGLGPSFEYTEKVEPQFTPWITLGQSLGYLDMICHVATSSFLDGVPLSNVQVGQVALIDSEIVRIDARDEATVTIARGCYDTVPTRHLAGARMWFFQAEAGNDPTAYPLTMSANNVLGAAVQVKVVPGVYGPPLSLDDVPTDRLSMGRRVERPYAPGEVRVNTRQWYFGSVIEPGAETRITWNHRNRDTQAASVVDHHAATRVPEDGQKYRLKISLTMREDTVPPRNYTVTIREEIVDGSEFVYTYAMAQQDGYRSGTLLDVCGRVTVGMTLESVRGELSSWQYYVIPLALPSFACPPGRPGGGGQLPGSPPPPVDIEPPTEPTGPGDNTGGGDPPPSDNDDGDNGDGPPPPPDVPPDWPDPIDPPIGPDPNDPNPELAGHWDTNWDRHWDAYTKDNQGN